MIFQKVKYLIRAHQHSRAGKLFKIKGLNMFRFCQIYLHNELDFLECPEPVLIYSDTLREHFYLYHESMEDINGVPVFTFKDFMAIAREYMNEHYQGNKEFVCYQNTEEDELGS